MVSETSPFSFETSPLLCTKSNILYFIHFKMDTHHINSSDTMKGEQCDVDSTKDQHRIKPKKTREREYIGLSTYSIRYVNDRRRSTDQPVN